METYRDALTVFKRYITDTLHLSIRSFRFEDCTHDLLLSYMEFLNKNGNAETTCNNRLAAIRAYLWYVADDNISLQSVALTASHVPFLKVPKLTREVISEEDLKALLSAPPNTKIGRRDQMILILLYDSAIRVSELLSLDVSSVNLDAEIPYLRIYGKGDKERRVYFDAKAKLHLQNYIKSRTDDNPALFTTLDAPYDRLKISGVEIRVRELGRKISMERIHPHKFRRTMATRAIDKGMPIEQVQKILGHSQIDTTMQYAIVNQNNVKASHRRYIA